jgi:hypothetical protein
MGSFTMWGFSRIQIKWLSSSWRFLKGSSTMLGFSALISCQLVVIALLVGKFTMVRLVLITLLATTTMT